MHLSWYLLAGYSDIVDSLYFLYSCSDTVALNLKAAQGGLMVVVQVALMAFELAESKDVVPVVSMAFEQAESKVAEPADFQLPVFYLPVASYRCYPVDVYFRFYRYKHYSDGLMV